MRLLTLPLALELVNFHEHNIYAHDFVFGLGMQRYFNLPSYLLSGVLDGINRVDNHKIFSNEQVLMEYNDSVATAKLIAAGCDAYKYHEYSGDHMCFYYNFHRKLKDSNNEWYRRYYTHH